jgi:hypothetical protein
MTVYLLHFSEPLGDTDNPHGTAQHYLGYADDGNLETRMERHKAGQGAAIMRAVAEAGISFTVARTWKGDRHLERKLKDRHNARLLCPECSGMAAYGRARYGQKENDNGPHRRAD